VTPSTAPLLEFCIVPEPVAVAGLVLALAWRREVKG
jgi:hypothetical protein